LVSKRRRLRGADVNHDVDAVFAARSRKKS
jgi:hypothetical protein